MVTFHSITLVHPHPLLRLFFPSPFSFCVPSPPRCSVCLSVPLNLIRIACISMGPGYLREHGQVISEHTTKFTPSSSSSRCLKFKVGHGALSPSSLSDAMLCRSYVDNHSYSRSVSTRPEDQMHSTAHLMTLRFFLPPPLQIFFKKLEVFFYYKILRKTNLCVCIYMRKMTIPTSTIFRLCSAGN